MTKVLSFGSLNLDFVYTLDHIVNAGETTKSNSLNTHFGGKGLNQSIALKKAGVCVYHAGCIGYDGENLLEFLKQNNVNVDFVEKVDCKNGHAMIQVDKNGENSIVIFEGSNGYITEKQIIKTISEFSKGDFVVLQNEINNIDIIIREAQKNGLKIVLNPSPIDDKLLNLPFEFVDYFILNEIEAMTILNEKCKDKLLEKLSNKYPNTHIVLTLGSKGSMYKHKDIEFLQSALKTNVVDTTAAGDTFLGYFIAEIIKIMRYDFPALYTYNDLSFMTVR